MSILVSTGLVESVQSYTKFALFRLRNATSQKLGVLPKSGQSVKLAVDALE